LAIACGPAREPASNARGVVVMNRRGSSSLLAVSCVLGAPLLACSTEPPSELCTPPPPTTVADAVGCDGAALLERPSDPAAAGPWPVGTRRVSIGRLAVDVFYPAVRGSDACVEPATFDIRTFLPPSQQGFVSDARNPLQRCDCARDLPVDDEHGPWPVVLFVHGTAAFSTQSLSDVTHWASRGAVVLAATHPGLYLADSLALFCPDDVSGARDLQGDLDALRDAVDDGGAGVPFLAGALSGHVALVGHSAGANAVVEAANRWQGDTAVDVVVSLAGSAALARPGTSFLALAGTADGVVQLSASTEAWASSSTPRRFASLEGAGHLAFSDLCETRNADGENLLVIAQDERLCGADAAEFLFDCSPELLDDALARPIVRAATSWAFEERLFCAPPAASFPDTVAGLPGVAGAEELLE
jgi:alpha-beta hydrolase superfamily lysophospholipase